MTESFIKSLADNLKGGDVVFEMAKYCHDYYNNGGLQSLGYYEFYPNHAGEYFCAEDGRAMMDVVQSVAADTEYLCRVIITANILPADFLDSDTEKEEGNPESECQPTMVPDYLLDVVRARNLEGILTCPFCQRQGCVA